MIRLMSALCALKPTVWFLLILENNIRVKVVASSITCHSPGNVMVIQLVSPHEIARFLDKVEVVLPKCIKSYVKTTPTLFAYFIN